MEQNIKQNFLTFEKGVTSTPIDMIADDNTLTEATNITYQDGAFKPIQEETTLFALQDAGDEDMLYVHKCANFTHYITFVHDRQGEDQGGQISHDLYYYVKENDSFVRHHIATIEYYINSITSVGSILVISTNSGIKYIMFKNGEYTIYDNIPQPKLDFFLGASDETIVKGSHYDILEVIDYRARIVNGKQQDYNALVTGLLAKARKEASQRKRFYAPFFVRYAVRLFDNSYIYISNPVLLFPAITRNCYAQMEDINDYHTKLHIATSALMFCADYDYTEWKDIVKGVDVFVTAPTEIYNLSADHTPYNAGTIAFNMIRGLNGARGDTCIYRETSIPSSTNLSFYFAPLKAYEDSDIEKQILSNTVFYKLCELPSKKVTTLFYGWDDMAEYINIHTLENITNQDVLKNDDYYSRAPLVAKNIYTYNSRLNIAGTQRGFFEGFEQFMPYTPTDIIGGFFKFYVYIHTNNGDKIISHTCYANEIFTHYYYYPDPRAYRVLILKSDNKLMMDAELKEHPSLNGAYYFKGLPTAAAIMPTATGTPPESTNNGETETLDSTVLQSEPNNPFVIKSTGDTSVGTGQIVGICSNTKAISQGQFGQFPVFVFTTDGIYTMSVNSDGTYSASHPFSREVCSNPKSITPIDDAIIFVSKKGLMMITDSVQCISEQLYNKKEFQEFLQGCTVAYDYRDNLIHFINNDYSHRWVYNIKSHTFSIKDNDEHLPTGIVNDYPDTLITIDYNVCSFYYKPLEQDDANTYDCIISSRPCKFGELLVMKSIRRIKHIYNFNDNNTYIRLNISASNDCKIWNVLNSITGAGWKFFKFTINISNMKADDRYVGLEVITQPRRTNKIR
jgi:hypothetical protein